MSIFVVAAVFVVEPGPRVDTPLEFKIAELFEECAANILIDQFRARHRTGERGYHQGAYCQCQGLCSNAESALKATRILISERQSAFVDLSESFATGMEERDAAPRPRCELTLRQLSMHANQSTARRRLLHTY